MDTYPSLSSHPDLNQAPLSTKAHVQELELDQDVVEPLVHHLLDLPLGPCITPPARPLPTQRLALPQDPRYNSMGPSTASLPQNRPGSPTHHNNPSRLKMVCEISSLQMEESITLSHATLTFPEDETPLAL